MGWGPTNLGAQIKGTARPPPGSALDIYIYDVARERRYKGGNILEKNVNNERREWI